VDYFIEAETDSGATIMAPAAGSIAPFSFVVGDLETIYCTDFEEDDGDYIHFLLSGEETEGADDWQWGRPGGLGGDPDFAWSGSYIWGNDISLDEQWNGEYQNDKHNRLTSAPVDIGDYEQVVLEYRRWLNVEDGYYDQARILSNGEIVWENHATSRSSGDEHHQDTQWVQHVVELPGPDADGLIEISWELETDEGLSMGGWNLDDVCIKGVLAYADDPGDDVGSDDPGDGVGGDGDVLNIEGGEMSGCSCSSGPGNMTGLAFWGGLLGLLGLGRRRMG